MESFNPSELTTYTEVRATDVNELDELHGLYKALALEVRRVFCAEDEVKRTAVQRTDESRKLVSHGSHYLPEGPALALLGRLGRPIERSKKVSLVLQPIKAILRGRIARKAIAQFMPPLLEKLDMEMWIDKNKNALQAYVREASCRDPRRRTDIDEEKNSEFSLSSEIEKISRRTSTEMYQPSTEMYRASTEMCRPATNWEVRCECGWRQPCPECPAYLKVVLK